MLSPHWVYPTQRRRRLTWFIKDNIIFNRYKKCSKEQKEGELDGAAPQQKHSEWRLKDIGQAVKEHRVMEIEYERLKESRLVKRRFQSVGIIFQGCYFSSLFLSHLSQTMYRISASSYFDQSSLWPQRSQNFWYSLSSVILHLGQSAYERKVGKT